MSRVLVLARTACCSVGVSGPYSTCFVPASGYPQLPSSRTSLPKQPASSPGGTKLSGPACCKHAIERPCTAREASASSLHRPIHLAQKSQLPISTVSQRINCYSAILVLIRRPRQRVPCSTQDGLPDASFHACACTLTRGNARALFLFLFRLDGTVYATSTLLPQLPLSQANIPFLPTLPLPLRLFRFSPLQPATTSLLTAVHLRIIVLWRLESIVNSATPSRWIGT